MIKDYYALLGLPRSASAGEIKQAYRKLAARYHPDRIASQGKEALEKATVMMMELNEAFRVLSHPERKAEYDQEIELIPERPLQAARPASAPEPRAKAEPAPPPPPAPPKPAPAAAPPQPLPRMARPTAPKPEAHLDPEYGARLKMALSRMGLKWKEERLRGWDWALEVAELRRGILVLYRAMDNLSLLSLRAVQASLDSAREQRKSPLRKTTVLAVLHIARVLDARTVQEQLSGLAGASSGFLGNVQSVVVLREGSARPVVYGSADENAEAAKVLQVLRAVN